MKKISFILIICLSIIFLGGCDISNKLAFNGNLNNTSTSDEAKIISEPKEITSTESPKDTSTGTKPAESQTENKSQLTSPYKIKDFYPFRENVKYEYAGSGNEYATYTTWIDYIKENRMQVRKNNGGTEAVTVLENKEGELKIVFSREETYFREDFTSRPNNKNEILLKEPLTKGTNWTLPDGRKRYISNTDVPITVPNGSFKALEVTTEGKDYKNIDYYALNTGLVKSLHTSKDIEVSSSLKKIQNNSSLLQKIKFYYPYGDDYKTGFITKEFTFKTNDITRLALEKAYKGSPKTGVGKVFGPNVKIKSLYLNNDVVYVDFSKELVGEMNAGSGYELSILQSITNTLGDYYNVNKVYMTIENTPYSSGHVVMEKGETFTVDISDSIPIK
jgi:spore germination protein GerM